MRQYNHTLFRQVDRSILDPHAIFRYTRRYPEQIVYDDPNYKSNYKSQKECLQGIKKGIIDMWDDGFDFIHSSNVELAERLVNQHWKIINFPKMRLRFTCDSCRKKFTTSKGTIEARLKIVPINIFNRHCSKREIIKIQKGIRYATPFIVFYELRIYRMACKRCKKFLIGKIDEPCLLFMIDILCLKISKKLTGQRSSPPSSPLNYQRLQDHKSSLCQACKSGKCDRS